MADAGWVRVAGVADVPEGKMVGVRVGARDLAVFHMADGEFCVTDNICTHEFALLSDGWFEDGCIECPLHAGRFDVKTGKGQGAPIDKDLPVFEVKVEGNDILARLPA
jgi:nitrite reductase/ring-hydroxylating ferredoxin subunit